MPKSMIGVSIFPKEFAIIKKGEHLREESNCYYAESLFEGAYKNAKAYFENGKLIKLTYDSVHIYDVTFSYAETVITLPTVNAE